MHRLASIFLTIILSALVPLHSHADSVPDRKKSSLPPDYTCLSWDDFIQRLSISHEEEGEEQWEMLIEQLEWLHTHPIDINNAGPEEMAILPFLTPAQIEAIQAYVHLDGPMKSLGELALIPALDNSTREVLPLFFVVKQESAKRQGNENKGWFAYSKHALDTRMDIPLYYRKGYQTGKYRSNPLYSRIRYNMESKHVLIGAHAKKDPGEVFYDSYGGYAMIRDKGLIRTAIIGDYRAGWGEGLVIGRGGYMSKSNMMTSSGQGIRPMTGVAEYTFLRGMAITLGRAQTYQQRQNITGTIFASFQAIDATLNEEGEVKTLIESGYHRTDTEYAKKHNTLTSLLGAHVQANIGNFQLGATGYWQHFNRTLSPGDDKYRRWYPRGKNFGIIGIHGGYSQYRWSISGEVAYSTENSGIAALGRIQWLADKRLKIGALGRYYDHKYHSFQASAICENSNVQNELGGMLSLEAQPFSRLTISAYADFFADYWPRYGMTKSSYGQELMAEAKWQMHSKHALSVRYQLKRKASNDQMTPHNKIRMQWSYLPRDGWKLQSTAYIHLASTYTPGYAISQMIQGQMLKGKALRAGIMMGYFHAPDYSTRVYIYEPSLWNSSTSTSFYGHGIRMAACIRYSIPALKLTLEAKYSVTHMFDRETISSGLQEILSPTRQDVSLQAKVNF